MLRAREWVNGLLELQKNAGNSLEFIESVKIDLFPDEIYVFTPKGSIFELPAGSTAVDFAYAIHTDVGNSCVACRINRRLAPLSEPLQSGQTVEIINAPGGQPNPAWLSFVVTGKARSNIRHYLKNQKRSESVALGRRLLNKALAGFGYQLDGMSPGQHRAGLIETEQAETSPWNRCWKISASATAWPIWLRSAWCPKQDFTQDEVEKSERNHEPLLFAGLKVMVMSYAKCCHPIPGDPIIGHISSGRGMVIHTDELQQHCRDSSTIRKNASLSAGILDVEGEFSVELRVELENQRGIIATLATAITGAEANIEKISTLERDARLSIVNLSIGVRNRIHLAQVMKRIRLIKQVAKVTRVKSRKAHKEIKSTLGTEPYEMPHDKNRGH